jgi:hypothetical protein
MGFALVNGKVEEVNVDERLSVALGPARVVTAVWCARLDHRPLSIHRLKGRSRGTERMT